ncbi:Protein NSP-INTERACTING KINASE 2 [Zea mays]|uniref:Protein NSP-INTERACTING KINASE 2 n=1 Tax=Zea mays TaxID=4577 RepID=A0A3L6EF69_MAIZE|nr:hypothetical protein Zm00014a_032565 [Zea mays]PWZ17877.1 Protein NSP-INTERACTING KINASE 2 [Zea mays]
MLHRVTFLPIVLYWVYTDGYQLILHPLEQYRLHTLDEEEEKFVSLCTVVCGILLQHLVHVIHVMILFMLKKMHQEKQLDTLVDKGLESKYDRIELEEMVQVALLCTQSFPGHRTKMSEVVRMLEGDGLAKQWEASQHTKESHKFKAY